MFFFNQLMKYARSLRLHGKAKHEPVILDIQEGDIFYAKLIGPAFNETIYNIS